MSIEDANGRVWIYGTREFGDPRTHPLDLGLQWILEQIHFGNCEVQIDSDDRPVSVIIGRAAAPQSP
jgi:hypothetical protein